MPRTKEEARKAIHENLPKRPSTTNTLGGVRFKRSRPNVVIVESPSSTSDSSSQVNTNSSDSSDDEVQSTSATAVPSTGFTVSDPSVFNCPSCTYALTIPVYQCEDGHFSCESCCDKVEHKCPTCRKLIGNRRCSGMEKVIESIKMSCKNADHGCVKKLSFSKKLHHENSCKYTPIPCPRVSCRYVGVVKSFYDHYAEKHPGSCKLIKFNRVNSVSVGEEELYLLLEEKTKILFFLNRVIDPLGSFVCVSTAPITSNMKFAYDLTQEVVRCQSI